MSDDYQQHTTPLYYNILPEKLHKDADELVYYLETFPFEKPAQCYYCGYRDFYLAAKNRNGIQGYQCKNCKRGFNQLTGTHFTLMWNIDKFGAFAYWRLSGLSLLGVTNKTKISKKATQIRDVRLHLIMQEQCPKLFKWWIAHQDRTDIEKTALVTEQKQQLKAWITELLGRRVEPCPHCKSNSTYKVDPNRAQFACNKCEKTFSLLSNTPFDRMHYPHRWVEYIDRIANGESHYDIGRAMGFSVKKLPYWKRKFLEQMEIMGLTELIHWIKWQGSRRKKEVYKENWESPSKRRIQA